MGLDSVELIMEVEDEFEIVIPDDEASQIQEVGALVECVVNKCERAPRLRCVSSHAFYRIRSTLVNLAGVSRRDVHPSSELAALVPVESRARVWRHLGDMGLRLPALQRPETVVTVATALVILVTAAFTVAGIVLFGGITAGLLAILSLSTATYLAYRLTSPWAKSIPGSCSRIADAVHSTLHVPIAHLSRGEISYKVRLIIAEQLGLPLDTVTEDKHFVNDLHVD